MSFLSWLGLALLLFAVTQLWQRRAVRAGARNILEQNEAMYSGAHEWARADPAGFPRLDHGFYDTARAELEAEGFSWTADLEDLTVSRASPAMRTFVRSMLSADGTIMAGIYHVRPTGFLRLLQMIRVLPRTLKVVDLETELSDGRFIVTSNSQGIDTTGKVPGIATERLPPATPVREILDRHRRQLREALAADRRTAEPGKQIDALSFSTAQELLASQDRLHEIKSQRMKTIGYMNREELATIAGGKNRPATDALAKEIERQKADRREQNE